jgi:hypothetical protein
MIAILLNHTIKLAGQRYVRNEYCELPDLVAAALLEAGAARRADGAPAEPGMVGGDRRQNQTRRQGV